MNIATNLDLDFMRLVEVVTSKQLRELPLERGNKIGKRYLFRRRNFRFS